MGLKNVPGSFQRGMDVLLKKVKWQSPLVYIDDIVIFLPTPDKHIEHVEQVLMLLKHAGVAQYLEKCEFFTNDIYNFGHVILPGRLKLSTQTTDAAHYLKHPASLTEIRSLLGLCSVFWHFVSDLARAAAQLNKKLRKGELQTFDGIFSEQITALVTLKAKLKDPPYWHSHDWNDLIL